jgi:AcrR family transcriptional regulator
MNNPIAKFNEITQTAVHRPEVTRQVAVLADKIESVGRQAGSRARRRRILDAARACFGEAGFAGATVGAIAERAGVSNGLLYQFFRNKEHLFEVVLREIIGDWVRAMVPRDATHETPSQALEGMFRRSVEFCRAHPLLPALLRGDQDLQLSRIREAGRDRVQPHRDLVASILRRGIEAGEFAPHLDVASAADVICQLQADYSARAYRRDPRYPDSPAIIDAAIRFILDAVRR